MYSLQLPLCIEDVRRLAPYDVVYLSGPLYVARDQAHRRLQELIDQEKRLPIELNGQTIYYMGPSPAPEGFPIGACGPTTSARMDRFAPTLLDLGLRVMIGKGPRSRDVVEAIMRNEALYLQAYGGCGALYASTVKTVETIAFPDLGPEALLRLTVERFPVVVAIDSKGHGVYGA